MISLLLASCGTRSDLDYEIRGQVDSGGPRDSSVDARPFDATFDSAPDSAVDSSALDWLTRAFSTHARPGRMHVVLGNESLR
jgi:hypothetical protein